MRRSSLSEKLFIEEVFRAAKMAKEASKNLHFGYLIKIVRIQLGMSQKNLSLRASVPQSTISRIEKGEKDANVSTLHKILQALFCDLIIVPMLSGSIDSIRRKQARKQAESRIRYLQGTMSLEEQQIDSKMFESLIQEEEERLLYESNAKLWEE